MNSKSHTLKAIYKSFKQDHKEIPFKLFSDICIEFNTSIIDEVLLGKEFNMSHNMGFISVRKVERDPRVLSIDWAETTKYKKELLEKGVPLYDSTTGEGEKWHIYYTDKFYCKFHWTKYKCKRKNKSVYRFDPTRGVKGNKEKLVALLKNDDLAYLRFKKYIT
jgi:hypothetical protein